MYNPFLSNKKTKYTEKITNATKIRRKQIQLIGPDDDILESTWIEIPKIPYKRTRKKQSRKRKSVGAKNLSPGN